MKLKDAYLAGLIDGDGEVMFDSGCVSLRIRITTEHVVDWLVDNFGGKKTELKPKRWSVRPIYRWRLRGHMALVLYRRIKPMLLIKTLYRPNPYLRQPRPK